MTLYRSLSKLAIPLIGISYFSLLGTSVNAENSEKGNKGAEIYCFMRETGNSHEVSWKAAYEVIKRQNPPTLFKTSPKHGAVLIVESVVRNPTKFQSCGLYLGDLFRNSSDIRIDTQSTNEKEEKEKDRYSF